MERPADDVRRRTLSGIRAVALLNVATLPLSFLINLVLSRSSPLALGYYGASQLFVGTFITFFVLGGPPVFARFVPRIPPSRRLSFLLAYTGACLALFAATAALLAAAPSAVSGLIARFGEPPLAWAAVLCVAVLVWAFTSHFLYGSLEAPRAAWTLKSVTLGYAVLALAFLGPLREALAHDPRRAIWGATVVVHVLGAFLGAFHVWRTVPRGTGVDLRGLPEGFWPVVGYVHLGTLVAFVYSSLSPAAVLLTLDVGALAFLHAAGRFPLLVVSLPAMIADVVAPGLASLDASGMRDRALRHATAAVEAALVVTVPLVLGFVFFARDAMALFGPPFVEHRELLRILALSALSAPVVYVGSGMLAAFGAFRAYLLASALYVATALVLVVVLVRGFGLPGAAWAATIGAALQQTVVTVTLRRRLGYAAPSRATAAWVCCAGAFALASTVDPGRLAAAGAFVLATIAFAVLGRVRPSEVRDLARRLLGRG
ncbi:MAG TPA: polysaccharide biosynthesis C-terminal domain-containing protein [Candidatus Polarisedimenticolaceae bacterium]